MKKCPVCNTSEDVREIIYGMPDGEPDESKYIVGGCVVSEDMPDYKCIKCSTFFYSEKSTFHNRFIGDGSGIVILNKDQRDSED